jgi:hypothetical protein
MLGFSFDPSRNLPMTKPDEKSLHSDALASPEPVHCAAPRSATADRRLRISGAAADGARRGAYRARKGAHGDAHKTNPRGHVGEPRDRSAGQIRATADRPAQRSDYRGAHDDGGRSAGDGSVDELTGELDRYHGFGKPAVSLAAENSPPRRLAGPRRELPAANSAPSEPRGELFLAAKH